MEAVKIKARVRSDRKLESLQPLPNIPKGEVEVIVIYEPKRTETKEILPNDWPALKGGKYLGSTLRREEIYHDNGR